MRTMRIAVVAMLLAMAAGLGVAAPAVADPSGLRGQGGAHTNRFHAQACQQGGHQLRVEAASRNPFRNSGDCASHTALGGTLAAGDGQVTLTSTPGYACAAVACWGELSMSGIPAGDFALILQSDDSSWSLVIYAGSDGSYNGNANIPCNLPTTRFSTFTATVPTIGTSTPAAVLPDCGPNS